MMFASWASAETMALVGRIAGIVSAVCLIYAVRQIAVLQAKRVSLGHPGWPPGS